MRASSLIFIFLLILSTVCILESAPSACKSNSQCVHSQICAMCIKGKGPACATAMCCDGKCVPIGPCSLDFTTSTTVRCPKKNN